MRRADRRGAALHLCDLDGTLLGSNGALSEFARDGLNKLLSAGIRLTVASSRATPAMGALLEGSLWLVKRAASRVQFTI
ncbi:MAG: HAD hydrolase family protein [Solirubrobacterales bacterium]